MPTITGNTENSVNLIVPSSRLPGLAHIQEDILAEIFFLLSREWGDIDSIWRGDKLWDWITVTEVCRYWHSVATRTPKLWSLLNKFRNTDRFRKFMQLSKDASLNVSWEDRRVSPDIDKGMGVVEFENLKTAMNQMGRIRHLVLRGQISEAQAVELLSCFELPAPRMRSVKILISAFASLPDFHLRSTSSGVLKEVSLRYIKNPVLSCLSCLSTLELRDCHFSVSDLLGVLNVSPALKTLEIRFCEMNSSNSPTLKAIHLPYLEYLNLQFRNFDAGYEILETLDAPNIIWWIIKYAGYLTPEIIARLNIFSKLLTTDFHADEMKIWASDNSIMDGGLPYIMLSIGNKTENLNIKDFFLQFVQTDRDLVIRRWIEIFYSHLTNLTDLDIGQCDGSVTTETYIDLFRACASTKVLNIRLGYGNITARNCLEALAYRCQDDEHRRLFPNLEYLIIHWSGYWEGRYGPELFVRSLQEILIGGLVNEEVPVYRLAVYVENSDTVFHCSVDENFTENWELRQWAEQVQRERELDYISDYDE